MNDSHTSRCARFDGQLRRGAMVAAVLFSFGCTGQMADEGNGGMGGNSGMGGRPGTNRPNPSPPPSGNDNPGLPTGMTPAPAAGSCKTVKDPGATPLRKLTSVQYRNTVRDLLAASGVSPVADEIQQALASLPADSHPLFSGLDNGVSPDHLGAFFKVATEVADRVTGTPERLTAVAGACATATPVQAACVDKFLASFGRRVHRRPVEPEEATRLRALADATTPGRDVFRSMIVALLTSPRFLNHLEIDGTPIANRQDYLQLTPYEIASRLSYAFWQTMPDEPLFAAAADGSLATDAGFTQQLERVYADPRTKDTVWRFWSEWLRLEGYFFGFATDRAAFRNLVAGENINTPGHDHHGDMVREIRELTEYIAFTKKGTIADLLTTDVSVTKSTDLARLYKVAPWDGRGEPPRFSNGTRPGVLTRSALLVVGEEQTNPFHRGAIIRKRLLCDPLPSPDPNTLPPGSLDAPPNNPMMTTRQRFDAKMIPQCLGCHTMFNDIGYVLENYDSLGRYRTAEKVFDAKGAIVGELPIDARAVPRIHLDDTATVNGPTELVKRIVDSKKVEPCFAQSFFAYTLRREVDPSSADACSADDLASVFTQPGLSLGDAYKRIALQAGFRRRKVGTP